jgi:NADPH-dependent ferric siderophore reductase
VTAAAPTRPLLRRRVAPTFHQVTVAEVSAPTPRTRRIVFVGPELLGYPNDGPGSHCKVLLPAPGDHDVAVPVAGATGLRWPHDRARPIVRTYAPRMVDPTAGRVVIDFVLRADGSGPASAWAAFAEPGDRAVITGGRGAYLIDPTAEWTALVADSTALPAVATILEEGPADHRVHLFAEVEDAAEQMRFSTAAALSTRWCHRASQPDAAAGWLASQAVRTAALPSGSGRFWVGLEAGALRRLRRHLLSDRRVPARHIHTRAYWKYGTANHSGHDTGEG